MPGRPAGRLSPRVMAVRGPNGSAPGIIEGQPWSTMPGSTSPWNGAAWAWWMPAGGWVVDASGRMVREAKVASEPEALVDFFRRLGLPLTRVGLEAGPLSQWLHAGLAGAGLEAVLLETRQVKASLSAMIVKTDRKDARGIA